jgi:hypothetical protein
MFLCSWSVLCANVPGPDATGLDIFRRKLYLVALCLLGPEFIFQIALGQWVEARKAVKGFHSMKGNKIAESWTIRHAFFVNMGGFVLQTKDWVPFPINSKQLQYLVTNKYVAMPELDERLIKDKNKADGLLRFITLCQILWFLVDLLARYIQHLEITCGDLTTAAFIVCTLGTTFCWYYKPADVITALVIETDAKIEDILLAAGESAQQPYFDTPLDFISRKEWSWSLYWSNWVNILRNMGIKFGPHIRPVNHFSNTRCFELKGTSQLAFLGVTAVYSAIFICGWNYSFPTQTELYLWRAASLTIMGTLLAYWGVTEFAFTAYPSIRQRFTPVSDGHEDVEKDSSRTSRGLLGKIMSILGRCRNNSISKNPGLDLPLKAILPIYIVGVFYCHARVYLYIADIIQLRSLPPSVYQSVQWSDFIPHF